MRDALVVLAVIAFFTLGGLYIAACARILATTGNIDEPLEDDAEAAADQDADERESEPVAR